MLALALLAGLSGILPAPTQAREPLRPLPGYRPSFATERDVPPPWTDCLWASASMLLDKWTAGQVSVGHARLRELSRDRSEGSNLADVAAAFDRLGLALTYSPDGGDFITWPELLDRLRQGGGAVLLGDYGQLPRQYGRWDRDFWARTGDLDNHALYVDAYDKAHDRIWVMDPLAPAGWTGEWVPRKVVVQFAWRTPAGGLYAAMTPVAEAAPFSGVTVGGPKATVSREALRIAWPLDAAPEGWQLPAVTLETSVTPLESGLVATDANVLVVPAAPRDTSSGATDQVVAEPAAAGVAATAGGIEVVLPIPADPGAYAVSIAVVEDRFGQTVAAAGPYTLFVPGARRATFGLDPGIRSLTLGASMKIDGYVVNTGVETWADPVPREPTPAHELPRRQTAVWAAWISDDPALAAVAPPPARLQPFWLGPSESGLLSVTIAAPPLPGRWALALDVADVDGSFAAAGSAPASITVYVTAVPAPQPE
jgi:hypothetical protein